MKKLVTVRLTGCRGKKNQTETGWKRWKRPGNAMYASSKAISEVGETPGDLIRDEGPQISFIYTPLERTNVSVKKF